MLVLALDTTTRGGSVAVMRDAALLSVLDGDASRTHGERLPGELEAALRAAGVAARDLDLLAVASGPGAFTGLRIGLAAIQGLAMVLGKLVVGVSALDALAEVAGHDDPGREQIGTWIDAQRGEVFAAYYERGAEHRFSMVGGPMVAPPDAVMAAAPFARAARVTFVGDGAIRYRTVIADTWPNARVVDPVPSLAPAIARLGIRAAQSGAAGPPHALQPLYVRRPDAELDRERQADR